MERRIQHLLQRMLGFHRYLYVFSRFKSATLRFDRNERDVLALVELMPRDGVVLDIGANIGIMTVHLARRVRSGAVHAFEPVPENLAVLLEVVQRRKLTNVTVHGIALGDSSEDLEMVMPVESSVRMQGLSRVLTGGERDPQSGERYVVPQRRLDDIRDLCDVEVAGIKIDVEDFEQFVFAGARGLIERCRPVVYTELGEGENRRVSMGFFEDLDYLVGVNDGGSLVAWDPHRHDKHNFFMVPAEKAPWVVR